MTPRVALALTGLALLATACGSRVDEWPEGALEPTDYFATRGRTAGGADAAATAATGDRGSTSAAGSSNTSKGNSAASTDAAEAAGPLPAPTPGTYIYDQSSDAPDDEPTSSRITWAVERTASSVTLTSTEQDDDGEFAATITSRFRVTTAAFELLSTKTEYKDEDPYTCTYKPAILVLKLPLKTGDKWKATSACEGEPADEAEFLVTGRANDFIGGTAVATFVVVMKQSFDSTDDTTGERTTFSFEDARHVDPRTLLTVIEDITFTVDGEQSTVRRKLRSLTPT